MNFSDFQRLRSIMAGGQRQQQQPQPQVGPAMMGPALFASEHAAPGQTVVNTPLFPVPAPTLPSGIVAGGSVTPAAPMGPAPLPGYMAGAAAAQQLSQSPEQLGGSNVQMDPSAILNIVAMMQAQQTPDVRNTVIPSGGPLIDPGNLIHDIGHLFTNPPDIGATTAQGVEQGGRATWGGLQHPLGIAKEGVTKGMEYADKPRQYNTALIGRAIYDQANGNDMSLRTLANPTIGIEEATGQGTKTLDNLLSAAMGREGADEQSLFEYAGDPKNQAEIQNAFDNGYDVKDAKGNVIKHFDGYQAVWEQYQAHKGLISRGASALVTDPTTYLPVVAGFGQAMEGSAVARELAGNTGKATTALSLGGRVLQAPDKAFELPFWAGGKAVGFGGRIAGRVGEARGISRVAGPVGEAVARELGPTDAATRQAFEQEREIAYFNHRRAQQDAKAMGISVKDEGAPPDIPGRVPGENSQDYVTLTGRGNETIYQGSTPRTVLPEAAPVGAPQTASTAATLTPVQPPAATHDVRQSANGKWQVIGPDGKVRVTYGTEAKATAKAVQLDAEAAPHYTTKRVTQNEMNIVNPDGEVVGSITGTRNGSRAGLVVDDLNSGKSPRESIVITRPSEQAATAVAEQAAPVGAPEPGTTGGASVSTGVQRKAYVRDADGTIREATPDEMRAAGLSTEPDIRVAPPPGAAPGVGLSEEITQAVTPPPNPRQGWSLQGALFDELQATDPEAATRIIAQLQPDAAAFEAKMIRTNPDGSMKSFHDILRPSDQVIEEAKYAARIRQALADEGIDPAEWQLRFQDQPNSPAAQIERIIHTGDTSATTRERSDLYSLGTLRKKPPKATLADEIRSGTLPYGKVTVDGQVYYNADLLRMTPQKRDALANLAVTEQQAAYQRFQDIGAIRQDLHGVPQAAEQAPPLSTAATWQPAVPPQGNEIVSYEGRQYRVLPETRELEGERIPGFRLESRAPGGKWEPESWNTHREDISIGYLEPPLSTTPRSPESLGITALSPEQQQGAQFGRDVLLGKREASQAVAAPEPGYLSGMEAWGGISPEERQLLSEQVPHDGEVKNLADALDDVILKNTPQNATREDEHAVVRAYLASVNPHATKAERSVMDRIVKAYDTFSQVQRENIQYNIVNGLRGSLGDMIGDSYTTMISHGLTPAPKYLYPRGVKRFLAHQRGQGDEALLQLKDARVYSDLGLDSPGHEVISVHGRVDPGKDQMTLRQGAQKIGLKGRTSGSIIGLLQNKFMRDLRVALDQHKRLVLKTSVIRDELNPAKLKFLHYLEDHADRLGINPQETYRAIEETATARIAAQAKDEKAIFTGYQGAFSPADVKVATGKEELARVWKGEVNRLNATGRDAVNHTLFSYKGTKADQQLGRLLFFHYWQSRALLLHTRLTLENPWLLAAYGRTWDYLQTQADKEGYPDSIRGYLGYMADNNYIGAINPLGIILPSLMYSDLGGQNGQGRDWEKFAGKFGLFINPVLQSAASAIGWGSRANDPSSTYAVRNMVRSILDYDRNHGNLFHLGPGMTDDVVQQFTNKVMHLTSGLANAAHLPYADKLQETDPHATDIGQINNIIQTEAEKQYGPASTWSKYDKKDGTNEAWSAVVEAQNAVAQGKTQDNPLAETALDAWSRAGLQHRGWAAAIPGGVKKVYAPQAERRQLRDQGYSAMDQGGVPTDQQSAAMTADNLATASPEARTLGLQQNQYSALGTDQQQFLAQRWNAISFGTLDPNDAVLIYDKNGARTYTNDDLLKMTADERKALADQYVTNYAATTEQRDTGVTVTPYMNAPNQLQDLRDQQKTFKADPANTDYAAYSDWRSGAYSYTGGVAQFRKDMSRISPGYRAYINSLPADISPTALDQKAVSADAYLASKGEKSSIYQGSTPDALDPTSLDPSQFLFGGSGGSTSGGGTASGTGGWTEKSVTKSLTDYKVKSDQYNQAVMSVTNGVPLDQLMPMFQQVAIKKLQDMGVHKPGKPGIVSSYELWIASLPQGSDTSVASFVKWYNDQTKAALAQYTPSVTATATP